MFQTHYPAMLVSYAAALLGWALVDRLSPELWPRRPKQTFEHPWREVGFALLGAVGVVAVGQAYVAGVRLPESGATGPVWAAFNQLAIFSPIVLVPLLRKHPLESAWLPTKRIGITLLLGLSLGTVAVIVYSSVRAGTASPPSILANIWRLDNIDEMTQVLLEDVAVAILFVRLASAIGLKASAAIVATLFAAGHIPVMVVEGASWSEFGLLLGDAGLGTAVILIVERSRNILWFWLVHFCMDMSQFDAVNGLG